MLNIFKKLVPDENKQSLKKIEPLVRQINDLEPEISKLTDEDLKGKTAFFKAELGKGKTLDDILPEAFAVVREVSKRTLEQRHYDVQLIGAIVMHQGSIAEMRTGEGKTLVATLPVYLNALTGKGVHVVTVNDYLSKRDAIWMGQIYSFLGLSVGILNHEKSFLYDETAKATEEDDEERDEVGGYKIVEDFLRPSTRSESYNADITYGTNNEFGFDYLRDNIETSVERLRQRDFGYAVIDEIDSILIDEARTPLIISSPTQDSDEMYSMFAGVANQLSEGSDFEVDEKLKAISLTDDGINHVEKILGIENIYSEKGVKFVHHLETAVRAKAIFKNDKEYVVRDGEVHIVDEFTGRIQPGRRWSEGLHQAIEAKEGVEIQKESRTFASITYQNFFKMYPKLSGMTGTALTSKEEFRKVYQLDTIEIPTHKTIARIDNQDLIFKTELGKFKAVARKVKEVSEKGQPVLIGTVSVEKNELLSEFLKNEGVKHEVLNAKNHSREGEIVAQAGRKGHVTIATNMAGRGVDIKLGGNPATEEEEQEVKDLGGLFVLATERHEARRIDNQLRGRSGRQGDNGETQFFVSTEDSLMRVFASDMIKGMMDKLGVAEDEPIENKIITRSLEKAQARIEGFNFDSRKHVLEYDNVMSVQRSAVYEKRRKILVGKREDVVEHFESIIENAEDDVKADILKRKEEQGDDVFFDVWRKVTLQAMDAFWIEHLEAMAYMRSSVNLRAYGQRDPLVEYKKEGQRLFNDLQLSIASQIVTTVSNVEIKKDAETETLTVQKPKTVEVHESTINKEYSKENNSESKQDSGEYKNVGRNESCPCGSGKKFKKCHGKSA
jgi:preprotein translocase subunit SecA